MAKHTPADKWTEVRRQWEADPTLTFDTIAGQLGLTRQAVSKKARNDGWAKVGALKKVAEKAQFRADAKVARKVAPQVDKAGKVAPSTSKNDEQATFEASVEIRAEVIEQHRKDWREHREHFAVSGIAQEFDLGKKAKISAEMLMIRQKGERAAYGLEDTGAAPTTSNADILSAIVASLPD